MPGHVAGGADARGDGGLEAHQEVLERRGDEAEEVDGAGGGGEEGAGGDGLRCCC